MKTLIEKVVPTKEELKSILCNMGTMWLVGKVANVISNSVFHYDLNRYNSVDHAMIGVAIGTYTYKKTEGGVKGILAGLAAATMFNIAWETFELKVNPYGSQDLSELLSIDTISDVAVVYAGTALSSLGEKFKTYLNKEKKK